MKKSFKNTLISIFLVLLMTAPSCLDLNEAPENMVTPVNFYYTLGQCESVLASCMNMLSSVWSGYNATPAWPAGQIEGGSFGYGANYQTGVWTRHWQCIANVNPVIKSIKYDKIIGASQSAVDDMLGQAYFMRAWQYFWLVQLYGKLPWAADDTPDLIAYPLTPESRLEVSVIYDKIEADLNEAFKLMDDYNTSRKARPCKWTAKALLAKVYLTRATAPVNDASCFAKAAAAADEVIKCGHYELLPIADIFMTSNPNNAEFIHAFQFTEDYPAMSGKAWGPEDDWDQWGLGRVSRLWAEKYPEQPRKNWYLRTSWPRNLEIDTADDPGEWDWIYYKNHPSDDAKDPWDGKKCWPNFTIQQQFADGGNACVLLPIMRISEMYLIVAEADNLANNGPTQRAVDYMNLIIDRANEPFESVFDTWDEDIKYTSTQGTEERASMAMSKEEFNEKVFLERQWELCFEFTAYFDLLRTRRLETWPPASAIESFTPKDYLFPIPAFDATIIGNNEGYE